MLQIYWLDWNVHFTIVFTYHFLNVVIATSVRHLHFRGAGELQIPRSLGMTNFRETNFKDAWRRSRARCR